MCPEEALQVPPVRTASLSFGLCPGQGSGLLYLVLKAKPQVCPLLCKCGNFIQSIIPQAPRSCRIFITFLCVGVRMYDSGQKLNLSQPFYSSMKEGGQLKMPSLFI